ncbi:FitA-like ribbon-helix-helix domain-containing protein [Mycobacterium tuberculosis]
MPPKRPVDKPAFLAGELRATIQVRDLPEDVAETYRRRATAAGQSLQTYMRTKLIEGVRGRDKAEAIEILEQALASTASPGISRETIEASRRELRGG